MPTEKPRHAKIGLIVLYASFWLMVAYGAAGRNWNEETLILLNTVLALGFLAQGIGLLLIWRGFGAGQALRMPRMLVVVAAIVSSIAAVMAVFGFELELPGLYWIMGMLTPSSMQRVCAGLSLFAVTSAAEKLGHRFRRNGAVLLFGMAVIVAASSLLVLDEDSMFFVAQPLVGIVLLLFIPTMGRLGGQ